MKLSLRSLPSRRVLITCLAGAVLAISISACGSSTSSSATSVAAAGTGVSGTSARYQARLNLAKCFRAHGLNVPDPSPGGGPGGGGGIVRSLSNYSQGQVAAARQACRQYLNRAFAFGNITPAQRAQFRQAFVKWAECMRSHGVNIPDPTTSGAGGFGLRGALSSVDRNSPAFQSAMQACQSLRPRFGRGGPSGGGGGPAA
jgi:hypothetical protein